MPLAEGDLVAGAELFPLNPLAVDAGAVGAPQVGELPNAAEEAQFAVIPGNVVVVEPDVARLSPADAHLVAHQGNGTASPFRDQLAVRHVTHATASRGKRRKKRKIFPTARPRNARRPSRFNP